MNDDLNTCLGFIRQTKEQLQNNKPVMAYNLLDKIAEYAVKASNPLIKIEEEDFNE